MVCDHSFRNPVIQQEFTRYFSDGRSHYECIEVKGLIETSRCIGYAYLKNAQFTERRSFEIPLSEVLTPTFTGPFLSSQPEVYSRVLSDTDKFIIFGSGGLWKLLTKRKAAEIVHTNPRDVCMACSF
jgi:serine/threonine protein phosphatase PrpC